MSASCLFKNAPSLHYTLCQVSSTIVPDQSGNGFAGVIRGIDRGGAYLETDTVFGRSLPVLTLTGGKQGGYLQLPDGCLSPNHSITVSFYARINELKDYTTIFSFGKDSCFYLSAAPSEECPGHILLSPAATGAGRSQEAALPAWVPVQVNTWFHAVVTFDRQLPSAMHFYLDGKPAGTVVHRRMNADAIAGCTDCYFGYGALSQEAVALSLTDIRIFPCVLKDDAISSLFTISDSMRLKLEMRALHSLFSDTMTQLPVLPDTGSLGAAIHVERLTKDSISDDFSLKRPASGSQDSYGELLLKLSFHDAVLKKTIAFRIPALPSEETLLQEDMTAIDIPFPGHITEDLTIPSIGMNGSMLSWESSHPEYLTNTGNITRPADSVQSVTLTLHASLGKAAASRCIALSVYPVYGQQKPAPRSAGISPRKKAEYPVPIGKPYASTVPLKEISLLDQALFGSNRKRCLDYLSLLDCDRMLWNFRTAFGQDTRSASPPGGWEEPAGLLRGHSTGHFLSAIAYAYASTHEDKWKQKADYLIQELRSLQLLSGGDPAAFVTACNPQHAAQSLWSKSPADWGEGYLSAYPPDQFALLEQFTPYATIWAPYYTLHKILAGFLDCYLQMDSQCALDCAKGIGTWVFRRLSSTTSIQRGKMWSLYIAGEYGGMNESLARLAQITGERLYMEAAAMFDNPVVFDGLSNGLDTVSGLHANQHIPQIIGALQEFRASGEEAYYRTAYHFWQLITSHYAYSIGGVGRGENFKEPDILAGNIETLRNCETCAAYNMLKLTGMLAVYSPYDSRFMDYYERTLYNQIAASQNPRITPGSHHGVTYMLPIGPGALKEYSNDYEDFTCCHGTGMENHVRYSEYIYLTDKDDGLFIQLYLASSYHWKEKQLTLTQVPDSTGESSLITLDRNAHLKLYLRIPGWCRDSFAILINGIAQTIHHLPANPLMDRFCGIDSLTDQAGGYALLERDLHCEDQITVRHPYRLHLCYTPDLYEGMPAASVMYGPLVMTALDQRTDWITLSLPPVAEDAFQLSQEEGMPVLWYDSLKFIPMYAAHNMAYHTYFKINLL